MSSKEDKDINLKYTFIGSYSESGVGFSKVNPKRGISLIVLVITIIIMIILAGVTITSVNSSIDDAKEVAFINDVLAIEDSVMSDYILTGDIASVDDVEYTKDTISSLITSSTSKTSFLSEVTLNGDEDSVFFKLSVSDLDIDTSSRGNGDDSLDYYIVAYPTMNVYYLKGIQIGSSVFFSTVNLSDNSIDTDYTTDNSSTSVYLTSGINVTRNTSSLNSLGIKLEVNMETSESLYISFCEDIATSSDKRLITTNVGSNTISFNSLVELQSNYANSITSSDIAKIEGDLDTRETDRYIYIGKYEGNELVGSVKIDLNNYGTISSSVVSRDVTKYTSINTITLNLEQGDSEIKEIRYVYDVVYNELGEEVSYYETETIDDAFILAKGTKGSVSSLVSSIKVHKYVKSIKVVVLDTAGNYTSYTVEILDAFDGYGMDTSGGAVVPDLEEDVSISKTEAFVGYYADMDADGTVDGVNIC